jgi:endonuclease/exonuclease/phosphatase (EEP) superfamily protein YafD
VLLYVDDRALSDFKRSSDRTIVVLDHGARIGMIQCEEHMASTSEQRRLQYIAQVRASLNDRLTDLRYQLRPQQPSEGLEYLSISSEAEKRFLRRGEPHEIAVWNTFKGQRERYYDFLTDNAQHAELILLQEFLHDPVLEARHRELFAGRDAQMAISFYTRRNHGSPTGVCTVSRVRSVKNLFLLSRYLEPVTRTPKMAMCTYYPLDHPGCLPEQSLLVLNSHGINFRLRRPFLDQMLQFEEKLRHHTGPIILVGDFNTWEKGRVRILEMVARSIGLSHVRFPAGIKAVRGHELDRVYIRGGEATDQRVFANTAASDHSMLSFRFTIA